MPLAPEDKKIYQARWRKRNPNYPQRWLEAHPNYKTNYYAAHRDKLLKNSRVWADAHKERWSEYRKRYKKKHSWVSYLYNAQQRCRNPKNTNYRWYGAKGIKCFLNLPDMKYLWNKYRAYNMVRPTFIRINPKGHYRLANCMFVCRAKTNFNLSARRRNGTTVF